MDAGDAMALFGRVLDLHGPALSSAVVGIVPGDSVDPGALPDSARQAAARLAVAVRRDGRPSRPGRGLRPGLARLDPADPAELELLQRFGAFSSETRVWVEGDPDPVVRTADVFDGLPRATYRLTTGELERLLADLAATGPAGAILVPRRSRASRGSRP
jgi:hypothetical protein